MRIEIPSNFPHESIVLMWLSVIEVFLALAVSRADARFTAEPDAIETDPIPVAGQAARLQ